MQRCFGCNKNVAVAHYSRAQRQKGFRARCIDCVKANVWPESTIDVGETTTTTTTAAAATATTTTTADKPRHTLKLLPGGRLIYDGHADVDVSLETKHAESGQLVEGLGDGNAVVALSFVPAETIVLDDSLAPFHSLKEALRYFLMMPATREAAASTLTYETGTTQVSLLNDERVEFSLPYDHLCRLHTRTWPLVLRIWLKNTKQQLVMMFMWYEDQTCAKLSQNTCELAQRFDIVSKKVAPRESFVRYV